jgi:hypothetical protein
MRDLARFRSLVISVSAIMLAAGAAAHAQPREPRPAKPRPAVTMWINHLDLVPGDTSVTTSFNATNSGVGGGLSGLIIQSSTVGDTAAGGGNKVVEKGLQVPPGFLVKGVRICYGLSNARSFITQMRLDQVQDPPSSALVRLDDGTDQTTMRPVCVNSQPTSVDPSRGAVRLSFRLQFGNTSDRIVLLAVGLHLAPTP